MAAKEGPPATAAGRLPGWAAAAGGATTPQHPLQGAQEAQVRLSSLEGTFACPEGGATLAALEVLLEQGWVSHNERIVLFNTGTGLKYPDALENR